MPYTIRYEFLHPKKLSESHVCPCMNQTAFLQLASFQPLVLYHQLYDLIIRFLHAISCQLTDTHDGFLNIAANNTLSAIELLSLLIHHTAHDAGINRRCYFCGTGRLCTVTNHT